MSALNAFPRPLLIDLATHGFSLILGGVVGWISRGRSDMENINALVDQAVRKALA